MRFFVGLVLLAVASAYRVPSLPRYSNRVASIRMAEGDKPTYEIVPLDKANIESAAAVTGGILGFVLVGPVGGLVLAALANYVSKKDNDAGEALRGFGKTVIESVNFIRKVDGKYKLTTNLGQTLTSATSKIATESEAVDSVKKTVDGALGKVKELNQEYDFVSKGKEVVGLAGTLSDAALSKVDELNSKYDFVEVTKKAATTVVEKIKEQSK